MPCLNEDEITGACLRAFRYELIQATASGPAPAGIEKPQRRAPAFGTLAQGRERMAGLLQVLRRRSTEIY